MGKVTGGMPIILVQFAKVKIFRGILLTLSIVKFVNYSVVFQYLYLHMIRPFPIIIYPDKTSLQNVLNTTRILIDPPIEQADQVRKRLFILYINYISLFI